MGKSFKIGTISGIPIKLHWSFFALFLFVYFRTPDAGLEFQLTYGLFVLLLFACITFHELGHAISARWYGVKTVDIILSPIGGVARLSRLPEKPIQELIVAIAGPMVNVIIAIVILLGLLVIENGLVLDRNFQFLQNYPFWTWEDFLRDIMLINVALVIFNLIPAFPMDGGRVVRALLSIPFSRKLATRIASILGQLLALAFVYYSLFLAEESDYMLALIGVFIFMSASGEYQSVKISETLKKYDASQVMRTNIVKLPTHINLKQASEYLIQSEHGDFILENDEDQLTGVVLRGKLIDAQQTMPPETPIEALKTNKIALVGPEVNFYGLFEKMQSREVRVFIVQEEDDDRVLGIIDHLAVNDFFVTNGVIKPNPIREWMKKKSNRS
jgi:Zn-dependent protease